MERRFFLRTGLAATAAATLGVRPASALANALGMSPEPVRGGWPGGAGTATLRPLQAGPLRLNSNENALGPSESARRAMVAALGISNRYTHPVVAEFRPKLAAYHGVPEDALVLGNGSTEVLQMAVQALAPDGRIIVADPTFEHVADYAEPFGLEVVKVPLTAEHAHDLERMRAAALGAARLGRRSLVYICNPNNPTGSLTPGVDVEAWIREAGGDVVFLVDEAYSDYVDDASYRTSIPLALSRPNVVVARTFSKVHGLAGLRLGYGIAHTDTAKRIRAFSASSNLNVMALSAAAASLADTAWIERSLASNREAARITCAALDELGLERIPSQGNFVMHRVPGGQDDYIRRMRERDVWVGRPFPPMLGFNRLSFGLPAEMERWAEVLREFRRQAWV